MYSLETSRQQHVAPTQKHIKSSQATDALFLVRARPRSFTDAFPSNLSQYVTTGLEKEVLAL